ncbi:MAG: hypothetical protein MHPDNHAH_02827 [Anaerolineales bacterium]|nr:hypothetical protein [Anaerolineales bacterium]
MLKVLTQVPCSSCNGKTYISTQETMFISILKYVRREPCLQCKGSGWQDRWIELSELARLLEEVRDAKQTHKDSQ